MFDHLDTMTDRRGVFEHADHRSPRTEHGYCTDDNARLLVVTSREPDLGSPARLSRVALAFTLSALAPDGRVHNRMDLTGRFIDRPSTDDCWGRAVWAWGVASTHHDDADVRLAARAAFDRAVRQRSLWPRSMAFAALGAAAVASTSPDAAAMSVLRDAVTAIGPPPAGPWRWPEARLTYANAVLAEAVLCAGAVLGDEAVLDRGLDMLGWLLAHETAGTHLSVTGSGGCDAGTVGPQFDQQPIEVAALADACWSAFLLTGDGRWSDGVALAARWFEGANDVDAVMFDPTTGGGYDGLTPAGANLNQGAESTLAYLSTRQRAACLLAGSA